MKKTIAIIFAAFLISTNVNAQEKNTANSFTSKPGDYPTITTPKDTTIAVVMTIGQFRTLMFKIDQLVDSKSASKELLMFLQQSAQIMQPADKPKEQENPKPKN